MLQKVKDILHRHKLRHTSFRQTVLCLFLDNPSRALSHAMIEEALGDHDRITLYRTLRSFERSGIIHKALDGADDTKYALCQEDCSVHSHTDDHPHFHCEQCGETYCMESLSIPQFSMPEQYKLNEVHLALSGVCSSCNASD